VLDSAGFVFGLSVFGLVFAAAMGGLALQHVLPESQTTGGSRDMTGAVIGLITLLLALVLGLLIWTAYGVYSAQKTSIQALAISVLRVDNDLHEYGPEADEGRALLRDLTQRAIQHVWNPDEDVSMGYVHALSGGQILKHYVDGLQPATDKQRDAKADAAAVAPELVRTRLQIVLGLNDPVSHPLITIVVAWAIALFFGYGLLSKATTTAVAMAALGALAVASALYAIVDLSTPYDGLFRVSPKPIIDVLKVVDTLAARGGGKP
jgi:hypothetical protein